MKLFIDANILVDLLTEREPYYKQTLQFFSLCKAKEVIMVTNSACMGTAIYYTDKTYTYDILIRKITLLNELCPLIEMNQNQFNQVLKGTFNDLEDGIQYESAVEANCTHIITRDKSGFIKSTIPIMTAQQFTKQYKGF